MQIGCWLTDSEAVLLDEYAASIELHRPALCALIIQRELCKPRLKPARLKPKSDVITDEKRRVTVRLRNIQLKLAFTDHVRSLGYGSDDAAAELLRIELKERSIFRMFGSYENHG